MTVKNRTDNKAAFENGDKPQGGDFANLIDSYVSLADTTAQTMVSKLEGPEFVGVVSAGNASISGTITYTGETTVAAIASGAVTLPASAMGYITATVSGVTVAIPYFRVG
jgi:hypothetical protein